MSEPGGGTPPQAIRRSDGSFHVLNVDLDALTTAQRVAVGVQIWPQVRAMLEAAGEYRERKGNPSRPDVPGIGRLVLIDRYVADAIGVARTSFGQLRPKLQNDEHTLQRFKNGEFENISDGMRAAGLTLKLTIAEGRKYKVKHPHAFFGHGDKFLNAIEPFFHYARVWRKKEFRYPHVNPKEAQKRIKKIDEMIEYLQAMKADLEPRSHVATLRVPSEKRRRKG